MARGWESKSVEDQMADARSRTREPRGPEPTADERERLARRTTLNVSRAGVLQNLQTACDARRRGQLEQALSDLDAAIRALE